MSHENKKSKININRLHKDSLEKLYDKIIINSKPCPPEFRLSKEQFWELL